jgi:hypothetical protein
MNMVDNILRIPAQQEDIFCFFNLAFKSLLNILVYKPTVIRPTTDRNGNITHSLCFCNACGLVARVPGFRTEMYCVSYEVRTEFIYVM